MNNIQQLNMILNSTTDKPSDTLIMYFNVSDYKEDWCRILGIHSSKIYTCRSDAHVFEKVHFNWVGLNVMSHFRKHFSNCCILEPFKCLSTLVTELHIEILLCMY